MLLSVALRRNSLEKIMENTARAKTAHTTLSQSIDIDISFVNINEEPYLLLLYTPNVGTNKFGLFRCRATNKFGLFRCRATHTGCLCFQGIDYPML